MRIPQVNRKLDLHWTSLESLHLCSSITAFTTSETTSLPSQGRAKAAYTPPFPDPTCGGLHWVCCCCRPIGLKRL